jgi:hypothetical protein
MKLLLLQEVTLSCAREVDCGYGLEYWTEHLFAG